MISTHPKFIKKSMVKYGKTIYYDTELSNNNENSIHSNLVEMSIFTMIAMIALIIKLMIVSVVVVFSIILVNECIKVIFSDELDQERELIEFRRMTAKRYQPGTELFWNGWDVVKAMQPKAAIH